MVTTLLHKQPKTLANSNSSLRRIDWLKSWYSLVMPVCLERGWGRKGVAPSYKGDEVIVTSLKITPSPVVQSPIKPVLESFCRFEVRVHFENRFFFFFFLYFASQTSIFSCFETRRTSTFLFSRRLVQNEVLCAHAKSMECTDLWDRYNLYNLYVTYAFGSAHEKFDV